MNFPATADGIEPVRSLLEIREQHVVIQKWDMSCGAAALATVLSYQFGDIVTERDIAKAMITREEYLSDPSLLQRHEGFSLLDLKRYVDRHGYLGIGLSHLGLTDLMERAPIIVPIDFHGYNHFVVFRGMRGEQVSLADPAWGNRTLSVERFLSVWIDYPALGKVGFAVEPGKAAKTFNRLAPRAGDFMMFSPDS